MEYEYEGHSFKSGIYKITNKLNGRIYIGSAKRFIERWQSHASSLRNQKHSNRFLQADFNKCGEEAFVFEVLEVTEGKPKEERLLLEEQYIRIYYDSGTNCYNLCDWAISRDGCKDKDPEKTKQRRREAGLRNMEDSEFRRKSIEVLRKSLTENGAPNAGKKHSEQTKKRMSEAKVGKLKSEEVKGHMSAAQKLRMEKNPELREKLWRASLSSVSKQILVITRATGEVCTYDSKIETTGKLGLKNRKQLERYLEGRCQHPLYDFKVVDK